jgi:hypothetical protein
MSTTDIWTSDTIWVATYAVVFTLFTLAWALVPA